MGPMKKRLSQKEFDKKLKVWTIVVPLITSVVGSLTAVGVAYISSIPKEGPKVEYRLASDDAVEVNKLQAQISLLTSKYFQTNDEGEREKLEVQLRALADAEANVMRKYNPNYTPRWPIQMNKETRGLNVIRVPLFNIIITLRDFLILSSILILTALSYFSTRWFLLRGYRTDSR
jgi:hypothetical protein